MSTLRLTVAAIKGDFEEEWKIAFGDISDAGFAAINEAAAVVKTEARANIATAGFSKKWQNALRVNTYRNKGYDAAAYVYHNIRYAGVFEEGATIDSGNRPMWIPLKSTPKRIGTRRMTAALFGKELGPLFKPKGLNPPLLFGKVALNSPADSSVTLNKIRQAYGRSIFRQRKSVSQGTKDTKRLLAGGRAARDGFIVRSKPMFFGTSKVVIPDKFSIREICERAANRLAELYLKNFKGD